MKINVLFHGASVTQQSYETSYFYHLVKLTENDLNITIDRKTYGGCHLNDAGFLNIDSDTSHSVDICFLEWNTTGLDNFETLQIRYIVNILLSKKIVPVFLILLTSDSLSLNSKRKCEAQVINFCIDNNLHYFDYRKLIDPAIDLRDDVHTNELGAIKYANAIYSDLLNIINELPNYIFPVNLIFDYSINAMPDLSIKITEGSSLFVNFSEIKDNASVFIETVRGPSSPIIDINNGEKNICIWDRWSHYERKAFVFISNNFDSDRSVKIKVTSEEIDYSLCAREFSFSGIKELNVISIYGVNCIVNDYLIL